MFVLLELQIKLVMSFRVIMMIMTIKTYPLTVVTVYRKNTIRGKNVTDYAKKL